MEPHQLMKVSVSFYLVSCFDIMSLNVSEVRERHADWTEKVNQIEDGKTDTEIKTGRETDRGREGETEPTAISSPVEQTPHILKYLPGSQDNGHSSCPSILTFGFPRLENFALMNEGIRFKSDHW